MSKHRSKHFPTPPLMGKGKEFSWKKMEGLGFCLSIKERDKNGIAVYDILIPQKLFESMSSAFVALTAQPNDFLLDIDDVCLLANILMDQACGMGERDWMDYIGYEDANKKANRSRLWSLYDKISKALEGFYSKETKLGGGKENEQQEKEKGRS